MTMEEMRSVIAQPAWESPRLLPLWLGLAVLVGGSYLLVAAVGYGVTGFPLDDAWIHQTYARNLATTGQWAFVPGQTSAGSTAPLWSLLLALGYWLALPYKAWTCGLGMAALGLTGWTMSRVGTRIFPITPWVGPLTGLFCVFEWHLVWASVSGMETILYIWLSVLVLDLWLAADGRQRTKDDRRQEVGGENQLLTVGRWWLLGVLGGLLALTRPEGLGLIGLIGLAVGWRLRGTPSRLLQTWLIIGIGLALPVIPYLAFHYSTTGLPFPNTFYAKQQEYRELLANYPLWRRWWWMVRVTLVGGQVLLLPGFVYRVWRSISNLKLPAPSPRSPDPSPLRPAWRPLWLRQAGQGSRDGQPPALYLLLPAAWWFAHLTVYALRLPVTYQHGRYQMPVIPFFLLIGVGGTAYLLRPAQVGLHPARAELRPRTRTLLLRVLSRTMIASTILVLLAFLGLGARAYATDVSFIQGEMVSTAHWLEANVPPDSLIAVHDIGAIGYFTPRPLLDLAGLVTPEVIPFITDEVQLIEFMQAQGADYVVFFPDWSNAYRRMAQDSRLELAHTTGFAWTVGQGHVNMSVYRLQPR
jgi:hypothetical protein